MNRVTSNKASNGKEMKEKKKMMIWILGQWGQIEGIIDQYIYFTI